MREKLNYTPGHRLTAYYGALLKECLVICLFGDSSKYSDSIAVLVAKSPDPQDSGYLPKKTVSFYFQFSKIRPYGETVDLTNKIADILKEKGWKIKTIRADNLVNTQAPLYWDQMYNFPKDPNSQGYNAAGAFYVMAEKDKKPVFNKEEVIELNRLALIFSDIVFEKQLFLQENC